MLKIYNKFMQEQGKAEKKFIHQNALWHKVVTGIIYNKETNSIIFQTIYPKSNYNFNRPDYMDFSVGGHIEEDEMPVEALKREALEEMGYDVNDYKYIGTRRIIADPSQTYKIREFQYIYALPFQSLDFSKMDKEVKSIIEININDLINLIDGDTNQINGLETIIDKETREEIETIEIEINRSRFIPDYLKDNFFINLLYTLKTIIME